MRKQTNFNTHHSPPSTGERFIPGVSDVTQADCLKQEIIHQLYITPLSHSELLKNLKVRMSFNMAFHLFICYILLSLSLFLHTYTQLHEDKELKKIVLEVAEFK